MKKQLLVMGIVAMFASTQTEAMFKKVANDFKHLDRNNGLVCNMYRECPGGTFNPRSCQCEFDSRVYRRPMYSNLWRAANSLKEARVMTQKNSKLSNLLFSIQKEVDAALEKQEKANDAIQKLGSVFNGDGQRIGKAVKKVFK